MAIFDGRERVRYGYSRYGWTRGGGKTWHGGIDLWGWTTPPSACRTTPPQTARKRQSGAP